MDDHDDFSPKAHAIIERIESGHLEAQISDLVVFETAFALQKSYGVPRERIAAAVTQVLALPGIILPGKSTYERVFELFVSTPLGFADCYHVALMERLGITEVLSFDRDFDRVPGIVRREA
jgi:predicted nucleic acid-binding protein